MSKSLPKVILLDDDYVVLTLLKLGLQDKFDVIAFTRGDEALEYLKSNENENTNSNKIDIIIIDLCMPVMDGNKFLENLSKLSIKPTPIILLSAYIHELNQIHRNRIATIIEKPVIIDKLITIINQTLNQNY